MDIGLGSMAVLTAGTGAPGTISPPVLVQPGTCLTLNLGFEMLRKLIAVTFSSASPLTSFYVCLQNLHARI